MTVLETPMVTERIDMLGLIVLDPGYAERLAADDARRWGAMSI
ncbi:hypothetical protein JCM17961_17680 [Endothiovibrio diazotrophicus]